MDKKFNQEINALESAKMCSNKMFMSKAAILRQISFEYTPAIAQKVVKKLDANYNHNALHSAQTYQTGLHMSKAEIYDQLISPEGDGFTKEQAEYAINHLS